MLKQWSGTERPSDEVLAERLQAAREKLARQQMQLKEMKLPVLVLVEGWGTSGKGSSIGKIIKGIDPRFFKVASMEEPTAEESRKPFLYRHFVKIPEAGKFQFLDSGWMDEIVEAKLHQNMEAEDYKNKIDSVKRFERQLTDNGYLVMKFFLHISRKEQKKRIDALVKDKDAKWRVGRKDKWQNVHYEKCMDVYDSYLEDTNMPSAPWYIIDAKSRKWTELQILETLTQGIEIALNNHALSVPLLQNVFPIIPMPKLSDIPLDTATIDDETYKIQELHLPVYHCLCLMLEREFFG